LGDRLELDNNRTERSFKPFVVGCKDWLFDNTLQGERATPYTTASLKALGKTV
jgi:hypothetical protein